LTSFTAGRSRKILLGDSISNKCLDIWSHYFNSIFSREFFSCEKLNQETDIDNTMCHRFQLLAINWKPLYPLGRDISAEKS
jgi:hypothetical protein